MCRVLNKVIKMEATKVVRPPKTKQIQSEPRNGSKHRQEQGVLIFTMICFAGAVVAALIVDGGMPQSAASFLNTHCFDNNAGGADNGSEEAASSPPSGPLGAARRALGWLASPLRLLSSKAKEGKGPGPGGAGSGAGWPPPKQSVQFVSMKVGAAVSPLHEPASARASWIPQIDTTSCTWYVVHCVRMGSLTHSLRERGP